MVFGKSREIQMVKTVRKGGSELGVITAHPRGKGQPWGGEKSPCKDENKQPANLTGLGGAGRELAGHLQSGGAPDGLKAFFGAFGSVPLGTDCPPESPHCIPLIASSQRPDEQRL